MKFGKGRIAAALAVVAVAFGMTGGYAYLSALTVNVKNSFSVARPEDSISVQYYNGTSLLGTGSAKFDVYINGKLDQSQVNSYSRALSNDTKVELRNITPDSVSSGKYFYEGWHIGGTESSLKNTAFTTSGNPSLTVAKGKDSTIVLNLRHKYSATFKDAKNNTNDTQWNEENTKISYSKTPAAVTGYTFDGWTDDSGNVVGKTVSNYSMPAKDITMNAKWSAHKYTVRFHGNGSTAGTMADEQFTYDQAKKLTKNAFGRQYTVTYDSNGGTAGSSSAAVAYTYRGWGTSADAVTASYTDEQSINNLRLNDGDSVDLYALWAAGSTVLPNASKTGNTFAGWYTSATGGSLVGQAGDAYTPAANITLYARFTPNRYAVTLNAPNAVSHGTPSRGTTTIYELYGVGFYLDQACTKKMSATENPITIPEWKRATNLVDSMGTYSTTFEDTNPFSGYAGTSGQTLIDSTGHITSALADTSFLENSTLNAQWSQPSTPRTLTGTAPTGYTFKGWYDAQTGGNRVSDVINLNTSAGDGNNVTYYAQWKENGYSIRFHGNSSTSGSMDDEDFTFTQEKALTSNAFKREYTVTFDSAGGSSAEARKSAYAFDGWSKTADGERTYTDGQTVSRLASGVNDVIDLYARWTPQSVSLPTVTRKGYTFNGWYDEGGNQITSLTPTKDMKLTAHWTAHKYTVRYNGNGSTSGSVADQSFTYDEAKKLTKNSLKQEFVVTLNYNDGRNDTVTTVPHKFEGWNTKADGNGTPYDDEASVSNLTDEDSGVVTLYAQWSGATLNPTEDPTRTGYTFDGWYDAKTGGNKTDLSSGISVEKDLTFYAHWTANTYSITFDKNGADATGTTEALSSVSYDQSVALPKNGYSRTGYSFDGWARTPDGAAAYKDADTVKNLATSGNVTLYAHWTAHRYTINFYGNGASSGTMTSQVVSYGQTVNLTKNAYNRTRTVNFDPTTGAMADPKTVTVNAQFNGWSLTPESPTVAYHDGQEISNLKVNDGDMVNLYAIWGPGKVTLPSATRPGYTFGMWFKDNGFVTKAGAPGTVYDAYENTETLYARYYPNYNITLNRGETDTEGTQNIYGVYNMGTYLDSDHTKKMTPTENPIKIPTFGHTLTLVYEGGPYSTATREKHTVTRPFEGYYFEDSDVILIDKNGYITDAFTPTYLGEDMTLDRTLQAKWGNSDEYEIPVLSDTADYKFEGWYKDEDGGEKYTLPFYSGAEVRLTLYSRWSKK